jgi:hypothetical protein
MGFRSTASALTVRPAPKRGLPSGGVAAEPKIQPRIRAGNSGELTNV